MSIRRRLAVVGVAVTGVGAMAVGARYARRRRCAARPEAPAETDRRAMQACECGLQLRASGIGRHTIVWAGDEAVLDGRCPACGRELRPVDTTTTS
jgi:hypothetical protein